MNEAWLDDYIAVWVDHAKAGGGDEAAMERLLSFMSADVIYEDVPSGSRYHGLDGIAQMAADAYQLSSQLTFDVIHRAIAEGFFALESEVRGINDGTLGTMAPSNKPFVIRSVSVGTYVGGKVTSHRDYWDLASLLNQLNAAP